GRSSRSVVPQRTERPYGGRRYVCRWFSIWNHTRRSPCKGRPWRGLSIAQGYHSGRRPPAPRNPAVLGRSPGGACLKRNGERSIDFSRGAALDLSHGRRPWIQSPATHEPQRRRENLSLLPRLIAFCNQTTAFGRG